MAYRPSKPNTTPPDDHHDLANSRWLVAEDGTTTPIVARSRRRVTVTHAGQRVDLKRRNLERAGHDAADGTAYYVTIHHQELTR